jgi:hypothetical protein
MKKKKQELLGPFSWWTFTLKTGAAFLAIAAACELMTEYSDWLDAWKGSIAKEKWALPAMFVGFTLLHLLFEVVIRRLRYDLERRRSSPAIPNKRATVMAARRQAVRNRRR